MPHDCSGFPGSICVIRFPALHEAYLKELAMADENVTASENTNEITEQATTPAAQAANRPFQARQR